MRRMLLALPRVSLLLVLFVQALPQEAAAQSGKLAGIVTDAETDEPIPGATVALLNTTQGSVTDEQGQYTILGISPGTYDVQFSFVGFTTQIIEGVLITSDRTTDLSTQLATAVVAGEEVLVEAERPVVDANQTTSRSLVTSEEISRLPVTTLDDVIDRTSNSYKGFLRGSRRFETKTMLEGIDVSDAFYAHSPWPGQQYGGHVYNNTVRTHETGASIFTINPDMVSEVTVNTGATEARYSTGSGGVVAISLLEGRGPISGSISARISPSLNIPGPDSLEFYAADEVEEYLRLQDQFRADPDQQLRASLFTWEPGKYAIADDPEVDFRAALGGSITDAWNFSAGGQWFQTNGVAPNEFRKRIGGSLKSTYTIGGSSRLTGLAIVEDQGLWGGWNNRSYHDYWRYYLEGVAQDDAGRYLASLQWTQILSDRSYITGQVYRTHNQTRYGYTDPTRDGDEFLDFTDPAVVEAYIGIAEEGKMFSHNISNTFPVITGVTAPDGTRLRAAQPVPYSEDVISSLNGLKFDYANQVTFNHFLQGGVELKLRKVDYEQVYGIDVSWLNPIDVEPYRYSSWTRNPWELGVYVSDRMEYGGLVVNLGLRTEFVNRDAEEVVDYFQPFRRDTIEVAGRRLARNFFERGDAVPIDVFFNPRIGVSHPIGSRAAMYFSYARNRQLAPYRQLYELYDGNHSASAFFNYPNPSQDPITSNNYELGIQWEFAEGWGADVNAYMRNIDNYGQATFESRTRPGEAVIGTWNWFTTSFGYADSRGIELVVRRQPVELAQDMTLGLTASYTYSTVEEARSVAGTQAFADNDPDNPMTQLPFDIAQHLEHFPQNVRGGASTILGGYDRRHRGVLRAVSALPYDFSVGLTGSLESGFLYERQIGRDDRDRELLTGPTNYQIDLRLEKRFDFAQRVGADIFLDIVNLTDRLNVIAYNNNTLSGELLVFERTGNPGSRLVQRDGSTLYGPARNIYFGGRVRF